MSTDWEAALAAAGESVDSDDRPRSVVVLRVEVPRTNDHHLSKNVDQMVEFLGVFGDVTIVEETYNPEAL